MRREKQILRYAQDDIFDSCYTLENLHVDHGARLDTPLGLRQDAQGNWTVKVTGDQGSGILKSMSEANCFIVLSQAQGSIEPDRVARRVHDGGLDIAFAGPAAQWYAQGIGRGGARGGRFGVLGIR